MRNNPSPPDNHSWQTPPAFLAGYGVALASTAVAALIRWMLPWALATVPYLIFSPAVVVAAALGGVGPGLASTIASLLLVNFVFGEFDIHSPAALIQLVIWTAASVGVSFLAGGQRAARQRAEQETATARAAEQALLRQVELIDSTRAEIIAREMQRVVRELGDEHAEPDVSSAKTLGEKLGRVPTVTGATVAGVGLLVLCGWLFGLEAFKSVLPGLATMKANTALCFLLAGAALALRRRRAPRLACAAIVCGVAALTLAEYITGADLGLDQLLFRATVDPHTLYPGRMAESTALGFALSGASLLLLESRSRGGRRAQQALAVGAGMIGAIALLGYAYDVQQLYRFAGYSSMALHTAAALLALVAGLIFARPDGLAKVLTISGPAAQVVRRLLPVALLVPALLGWLVVWGLKQDLYGAGMEVALLALMMMLTLAALVWWTAHAVNVADAARRETETQLHNQAQLMDHAYEPLIVREQGGAVLFWNRGAEALYGWPAAEAVGRYKQALLHTEGTLLDEVDRQLETAGHWEGELVHITLDGRRVIVDSRQTAIRAPDGQLLILESNRDITKRKRTEEALQKAHYELSLQMEERIRELQEKEVMLKEIHHRVKNNLQVISSLVGLQADGTKDESVRDVLREVSFRVRSMALVHEKLYQSENLARINFDEYIKSLLNYLWRAHGQAAEAIRLSLDLTPVALPVDTAVPCGLILNELAGNALKHAFLGRDEGEVTVSLRRSEDGRISLSVRDNGVGLPEELDWHKAKSLGLRLVQMLAGQLKAEVAVSRGEGVKFEITFMLPGEKNTAFSAAVL